MPLDPSIPVVYVSKERLRELFNQGQYRTRAARGEFRRVLYRERPAPIKAGQPRGTKSQMVEYVDSLGNRVALVHQYRLPSGKLGGSGLPDPKQLLHEGILYLEDLGD